MANKLAEGHNLYQVQFGYMLQHISNSLDTLYQVFLLMQEHHSFSKSNLCSVYLLQCKLTLRKFAKIQKGDLHTSRKYLLKFLGSLFLEIHIRAQFQIFHSQIQTTHKLWNAHKSAVCIQSLNHQRYLEACGNKAALL